MPDKRMCYRQTRSVPVNFQTRSDDTGPVIAGYFAVFNNPTELWPGCIEQIAPGAFASSLGLDVRALIDHDTRLVIGRTVAGTLTLREDETGLYGEIKINEHDSDAMNLYARVQRGDVSQCSFGFDIVAEDSLTLVPDPENAHSWTKETVTYGRSEATDNEDGTKTLMAGTATNGTYFNTSTYQITVDLTPYSVLKYKATVATSGTTGDNAARVGVGLIAEWGKTGTAFATLALSGESSGEVDISALTGEHPVGMQAQSHNKGTGTTTVNLFELVLE